MSDFEKASRIKLRFDSFQGRLSVEDLWDLPLVPSVPGSKSLSLDGIAVSLAKELKNNDVESFVIKQEKRNEELQLKFDIVKHIIKVRLVEREAEENKVKLAQKKQQILAIMAKKQNENLENMPMEELQKLLETL